MKPISRVARYLTQSVGRGTAIGAGTGAVAGALQTPSADPYAPPRSRLQQALTGAVRGGLIGAVGSGLGRGYRDTRLLNPGMSATQAVGGTVQRMGQGVKGFVQRQVHGFTGRGDPAAMGLAGEATAARKIDLLHRRHADMLRHAPASAQPQLQARLEKAVQAERAAGAAGQEQINLGLTSLPGTASALLRSGNRARALRAMGRSVVGGGGLGIALPLAVEAPSLARGDESATGGRSLGQKLRGLGTNLAVGGLTAGMPIVPQLALGGLADLPHKNKQVP